jgi:hypothetical protein
MVKVTVSPDRLKRYIKPGDQITCYLSSGQRGPAKYRFNLVVTQVEDQGIKGDIIHPKIVESLAARVEPEFFNSIKDKEISVSWEMIEEAILR